MGSQQSKTDGIILNTIGWQLDDDPLPMIYIGPTQKNVESISNDRVKKMIANTPSLYAGLAKGKRDKVAEKFINGVRLGFGWAGSATELASHPAAKVFIDERDRMGDDVEGEGDVNTLADARTSTYDGCVITTSTPLIGDISTYIHPDTGLEHWAKSASVAKTSPTWGLFQEGSAHEWAWPCPDCKEYFIPRFKLLWWPKDSTPHEVKQSAVMTCPHCGSQHDNSLKEWMNSKGLFVAPGQKPKPCGEIAEIVNDDGSVSEVIYGGYLPLSKPTAEASFWVSGLCSNWRSYGNRASRFLSAVRSGVAGRIQSAINTGFGELYTIAGEAPEWEAVSAKRSDYKSGGVPSGVLLITLTVDVQKSSLFYVVRGWGFGLESWLIEHGEIIGETDSREVWNKLYAFRIKDYSGKPIRRAMIDSGYRANEVYEFCRRSVGWAFPTKGHQAQSKPVSVNSIDVNISGKLIKKGIQLWNIDSDYFKSLVHSRMKSDVGWHLPSDITEDYCKQIVAESRTVKPSGRVVWVETGPNHYLDCEALAFVAVDGFKHLLMGRTKVRPRRKSHPGVQL